MLIIADDKIPYLKGVLEPYASVTYLPGNQTDAEAVVRADALITRTRIRCNAGLLNLSSVQFIASATVGFDHIDTQFCAQKGIVWTNAPGCNSGSVMQYMAAVLSALSLNNHFTLRGKTIAVVGVGHVGSKVAQMAKLLNMNVLHVDPPREEKEHLPHFVSYAYALAHADILTFHTPLTYDGPHPTHHLLNCETLQKVKRGAVVINTSRGEVTQTEALIQGVQNKIISHLILDVWENEPEIDPKLHALCLLATPHIAGYSADSKAIGTQMSVNALAKYFHLPLEEWKPNSVPPPLQPNLHWPNLRTEELNLARLILGTYPIHADDTRLRNEPHQFERLRGYYPLRREFAAYQVTGYPNHLANKILQLGFQLKLPENAD